MNNRSSTQGSHAQQWLFKHGPHVIINHAQCFLCWGRKGRAGQGKAQGWYLTPSVSSTLKASGPQGGGHALCLSPSALRLPEVGVCQTS